MRASFLLIVVVSACAPDETLSSPSQSTSIEAGVPVDSLDVGMAGPSGSVNASGAVGDHAAQPPPWIDSATTRNSAPGPDPAPTSDAAFDSDSTGPADPADGHPTLAAVAVWLDAALDVTIDANGRVVKWADQSGHGADAVPPSGDAAPSLAIGGVSGRPAIKTDRRTQTRLHIKDVPSMNWGTGDFSINLVQAHATPVGSAHLAGLTFADADLGILERYLINKYAITP